MNLFLQRNLLETKEAIERQRKLLKKRQPGEVFRLNHTFSCSFSWIDLWCYFGE